MGYNTKTEMPCEDCGEPTVHRQAKTRKPQCIACAAEVMEANLYNLQAKRGPGYEAWRAALAKSLSR